MLHRMWHMCVFNYGPALAAVREAFASSEYNCQSPFSRSADKLEYSFYEQGDPDFQPK